MDTKTWYRESTGEWVVETEGTIGECNFNIRYSSRFKWYAKLINWMCLDGAIKDCCA